MRGGLEQQYDGDQKSNNQLLSAAEYIIRIKTNEKRSLGKLYSSTDEGRGVGSLYRPSLIGGTTPRPDVLCLVWTRSLFFFYTQQLKKPVHVNMAQLILITSLPELSLGLGYLVISGEDGVMNPASCLVCAFSYRLFLFFFLFFSWFKRRLYRSPCVSPLSKLDPTHGICVVKALLGGFLYGASLLSPPPFDLRGMYLTCNK